MQSTSNSRRLRASSQTRVRTIGFAVALVGALLLHATLTGRTWLWDLTSPVPPISFLAVPLVLLIFAVPTRNVVAIFLAAVAVVLGFPEADLNLSGLIHRTPRPTAQEQVTVFSWNTGNWNEEDDHAAFYSFLRDQKADVYQLQEYWAQSSILDSVARIQEQFPGYTVVADDQFVTITKFPVLSHALGRSDGYLRTDQVVGNHTVRFYNVHLSLQFGRDMQARFVRRRREMQELVDDAAAEAAVYISGDFNATTAMGIMKPILQSYHDAIEASRNPLPTTWSYDWHFPFPLWRIDFDLASRDIAFLQQANVFPEGLSDHAGRRVIATF